MESWWELGEWSGHSGNTMQVWRLTCPFCKEEGNFALAHHAQKQKGNSKKKLNFDLYQCLNCMAYVHVFWSAAEHAIGHSLYDFMVLPWPIGKAKPSENWPPDVQRFWGQAHESLSIKNWDAAAVMARSAVQVTMRDKGAVGKDLYSEIEDLAKKGDLPPLVREWSHEVGLLMVVVGCFMFLTKDIRAKANVAAARAVHAFAVGRAVMHLDKDPDKEVLSPDGFIATLDAAALARSYMRDIPGARAGEYNDVAMMDSAALENTAWKMLNDDLLFQDCVGHADDDGICKGTEVRRLLQVRITNGLVLYIEECLYHAEEDENCLFLPGEPGDIEKDYWAAYKKSKHETLLRSGRVSLESGLWGFAGGIGIWALYRLVLFAVKG